MGHRRLALGLERLEQELELALVLVLGLGQRALELVPERELGLGQQLGREREPELGLELLQGRMPGVG